MSKKREALSDDNHNDALLNVLQMNIALSRKVDELEKELLGEKMKLQILFRRDMGLLSVLTREDVTSKEILDRMSLEGES